MDCSFIIYLTRWRCISLYSKRLIFLMLPRGLSCYLWRLLQICYFMFLFQLHVASVILLKIVLLIPLKYHTGNRSCQLLQYNIITSQPRGPYLPLSRGGSLVALVGVCIGWNLEPLASGGQSGHKLILHIIFQFLYAWEKTLNEDLFYKGSSANLPRLHTCENKVPFWDFKEFAVTMVWY